MMKINEKMLLIVSSVLVIMFGLIAFVIAQEKKKVEVKLLWQKQLDANVKDIAIAEEEVKPGVIKHEFIVVTDKGVKVLDKDGNVLWERQGYAFVSKQGKYIGIIKDIGKIRKPWSEYPNTTYEEVEYLITLLNKKGNVISQFKHTGCYRDILISDKGNIVVLTHFALSTLGGRSPIYLTFYDSKGNKLKETSEKFFGIAKISKNGEFIAFAGVRVYYGEKKKVTPSFHIILFNRRGDMLWQKEMKSGESFLSPWDLAISDNGDFVVVSFCPTKKSEFISEETLFYNKNGEQIGSFNKALQFIKISSGDGKYTVGKNGEIFLFETENGKLIYKGENVFPIDLTKDIIVTCSLPNRIYFYNLKGEKLYEHIFSGTGNVEGKLEKDGKKFFLGRENNLEIFEIKSKD